jgi:hypothetical protein
MLDPLAGELENGGVSVRRAQYLLEDERVGAPSMHNLPVADHMRTALVTDAITMAARNIRIPKKAIFHSDCAELCVKSRAAGWPVVAGCPWLIPRLNDGMSSEAGITLPWACSHRPTSRM